MTPLFRKKSDKPTPPDTSDGPAKDRSRLDLGAKGELIAEKHLKRKGFRTAARNLRNKAGELDLLMWDGEELVIVEVRSVRVGGQVWPNERVPVSKRRQLVRVARQLLAVLNDPLPVIRFDVVVVEMEPEMAVHHYENAIEISK